MFPSNIFAGNDERGSGLCKGPGDRLVGVPELHCESLRKDTMFWLSMPHGMAGRELRGHHARYADLREVRYARGVVGHGMVGGYLIADSERVKGAVRQWGVYGVIT